MSKPIDQIKTEILAKTAKRILVGFLTDYKRSFPTKKTKEIDEVLKIVTMNLNYNLIELETAVREQTIEEIRKQLTKRQQAFPGGDWNGMETRIRAVAWLRIEEVLDSLKSDTQASEEGEK
jgi:hypothetical protein